MKTLTLTLFSILLLGGCASFNKKFYTEPNSFYTKAISQEPFDALIIPGFPHHEDSMTTVVQNRVYWAYFLHQKGIVKNVIFSGNAVYTPYREGEIMALYAVQLGIPKDNIFMEVEAEHSTENLYYSHKLATKLGFKKIALATDIVQSSFLYSVNNHRLKIPTTFIPIVLDSITDIEKPNFNFDQSQALDSTFVSILERENLWQRLKGTKGKKVKRMLKKDRKAK